MAKKKKVLFVATVDSHILAFHLPYLELFKQKGWETHVATNGKEKIPFCDHKHTICMERSPYKLNNLKAIKQMEKLLEKEHFDIIHCHTPMGSVVTRLAAKKARKNGTRVIYTAHGFHFYTGAPLINWLLFYPVEWYLAKYTDTLITINHEDYNRAKKKFSKRCHDIQYVPGVGIDPKKFDFKMTKKEKHELRASLGLKDDDFVMIFPAELSKRKNQMWLIRTLEPLFKEHKEMHLLLPGRDSLNGKCQKLAKKLSLEHQVHFLGFRNDIPKLLIISDLAVSSAKQEGLPVNLLEAKIAGLPIVACACRGNDEIPIEKNDVCLIDEKEPAHFYKKVMNLYINNHSIDENEKTAMEIYKLENILNKAESIYRLNDKIKDYKKCIIVCWFGELPNYFSYWAYSASINHDYSFILFTDQTVLTKYSNIIIYKKTMSEMSELFSKKLKLDINIKKPYKFCDFRPAYGKIFEDYIEKYDFWGHCDLDQIFGKISNFISSEILSENDIVNRNGHFKLYRNSPEINNLFRKNIGKYDYREVFTSKENYAFDEFSGINYIEKKSNIKVAYIDSFSDIDVRHVRFRCNNRKNYREQCYLHKDKHLYKIYYQNDEIKKEEIMYVHFQKKKISAMKRDDINVFVIGSNGIMPKRKQIQLSDIERINPHKNALTEIIESQLYVLRKIKQFALSTNKEKILWLKRKF